jgi:hypothetical protein
MWRIFYDDGSTFDSDQGEPHDAPTAGFICSVGYDESGDRYIMHGWDHYCWDQETSQWWGMDLCGLFDRLMRNRVYAYKQGRTVTKKLFQETMQRAHVDPEFPQVR